MKMVQNRIWGAVVPVLLLSACATSSNPKPEPAGDAAAVLSKFSGKDASPGAKNTPQMGHTRSQILMKSGVEFLAAGELDKAKQVFNTALKFDIKNAPLHFLNALTYHTTYLRGDVEGFAMAEAGYRAAITHDASMDLAYLQLGRLYLDARDFTRAKQSMALAVESDNRSIPAYYGLAQAAFLEGDLPTSYWAVNELERLKWTSPALYRLKAMQAAVTRQPDRAHAFAAEYAKSTDDAADAGYLTGRVNRLLTIRTALVQEGAPPAGRESAGQLVAQAGAEPVAATKNPKPGTAAKPVAAKAKPDDGAESKAWFRCDPTPGIAPAPISEQPTLPIAMTDETSVAATLPAPCPGEKPRMAMFEVTMIRTEESSNKEFGINLLEGLAAVLTRKSATTFNDTTRLGETVRSRGYELVNSALGATQNALRYSLNIANAAYGKNEVIARPTIAAIDRVPAVFFSGANITLGVVGTGGGASTVIDKPVGVSLAVTPTFIDDDTVMVAIRATRSFIESSVAGSAAVLLQQTRNAISASSMLKFGETYVLSGLVEKAIDSSDSGTPVLRDIPVLQYLFKHSLKTEFSRQILTLVTIRRLVDEEPSEESKKMHEGDVSTHQLSKKVTEFIDVHADKTAIDEAMAGIRSDNQLYQKLLRGRDLLKEGGTEKSRLQGILDSLIEAAYF